MNIKPIADMTVPERILAFVAVISVLEMLSLLNSYRHYTKANEGKGTHQLTFPVLYAMCFPEVF